MPRTRRRRRSTSRRRKTRSRSRSRSSSRTRSRSASKSDPNIVTLPSYFKNRALTELTGYTVKNVAKDAYDDAESGLSERMTRPVRVYLAMQGIVDVLKSDTSGDSDGRILAQGPFTRLMKDLEIICNQKPTNTRKKEVIAKYGEWEDIENRVEELIWGIIEEYPRDYDIYEEEGECLRESMLSWVLSWLYGPGQENRYEDKSAKDMSRYFGHFVEEEANYNDKYAMTFMK